MRWVALLSLGGLAAMSAADAPKAKDARTPILVELFTSEGCSSCPAADAALMQLAREQPLPNVLLIGLEEHVDYWNNLGWADPFSAPRFTQRQEEYLSAVGRGGMYTPQAVIDGRIDALGSDRGAILDAAKEALGKPHGRATVKLVKSDAHSMQVEASAAMLPETDGAVLWIALVEDGLTTEVPRGENAGRTLPHAAVVRAMVQVAQQEKGKDSMAGSATIPLGAGWKTAQLRPVAFVQDAASRHILAAAL
jgi:hypothetical protein